MSRPQRQAAICHAAEDSAFARDLGAFLERNCPVSVSYEQIATDLPDAVERAISRELVLVALSPSSVPQNPSQSWKRDRWEPALFDHPREFGAEAIFLLAAACKFPELLRRKNFYDCSRDSRAGFRALKRRILSDADEGGEKPVSLPADQVAGLDPANLGRLGAALADRPGTAEAAAPEGAGVRPKLDPGF